MSFLENENNDNGKKFVNGVMKALEPFIYAHAIIRSYELMQEYENIISERSEKEEEKGETHYRKTEIENKQDQRR